jgi:hypothetical protein
VQRQRQGRLARDVEERRVGNEFERLARQRIEPLARMNQPALSRATAVRMADSAEVGASPPIAIGGAARVGVSRTSYFWKNSPAWRAHVCK